MPSAGSSQAGGIAVSTSLQDQQLSWYALYTRSRHEKLVEETLGRKGIETFLPLRKIKRKWSDRSKIIHEPLFKGYLFVQMKLEQRLQVLQAKGVVRLIGTRAEPVPVPERDLIAIRAFIEDEIPIDPYPYLKEGERVVVKNGKFRGVEGFLVCKKNQHRLIISLDLLQQSCSIEIDAANVEPVW